MPVIFKIIVFLILQQGGRVVKDISKPGPLEPVNWETMLLARPMTLSVQSDAGSVDEIISVCTGQDIMCEVQREMIADGVVKADVRCEKPNPVNRRPLFEKNKDPCPAWLAGFKIVFRSMATKRWHFHKI